MLHSKLSSCQRCGSGDDGYEEISDGLKGEALTKYDFLRYFNSGGTSKQGNLTGVWSVNLPESNHDRDSCPTEVPDNNLTSAPKTDVDETMRQSSSCDKGGQMSTDEFEDGSLVRMISTLSGSSESEVATDEISEVDESNCTSSFGSPSITDYDMETHEVSGCSDCPVSGNFLMALGHMVIDDVAVMIVPDYVMYGSTYYGESQLTFASDYIKIKCSDASGNDEISAEWSSDDIIHICCRWSESIQAALVQLGLRAHTVTDFEESHSITDVLQVKFSISDMHWLEKESRIKNLSERYKNLWDSYSGGDSFWEDAAAEYSVLCSRDNFTEMPQILEDVVYPKGDPDAVSISRRDFDLLQPETFINDTIIDFYIKFLKNNIREDVKHRFHFFNSFFFRKLADLDKDRFSDSEGRAAFLRVRKWTRKVNIFEKDYIFIPVNFNLHWSLLVICHPGEIWKLKGTAQCHILIHFTCDVVNAGQDSYLWEEWKERHPESSEVDSTLFLNLRFVPLELPQQENSFDCGLFLLHYVELFLEEAPEVFNPLKVTKFSSFLNVDWFHPAEASLKRSLIRKLLYKLVNDSSEQASAASRNNANNSIYSMIAGNDVKQEPLVGFCRVIDTGKEAELLQAPAFSECDKQTGLVHREFLELETAEIPLLNDTEQVDQLSCPIVDQEDEILQFTPQLVTTVVSPVTVGTAVSSIDQNVADIVSSPELFKTNTIAETGNKNEKVGTVLPEDLGCVRYNSPSSSSGRKSEAHAQDSQDINVSKGNSGESMRYDSTETSGENDVDSKDISARIAEGGNDKDVQSSNKDDAEEARQVLDNMRIAEVVKDNQGCQENACETEIEHCIFPETDSGEQRSESCIDKSNQPSASYSDIVITDVHSSEDDDVQLMETKEEQQHPKRRRIMHIRFNGSRRCTRSMAQLN